ncbi:MAG: GTPase Era [Anaerolineae bacterium]|nr:GTPase Era [Anaerolineae bacterium]
MSELPGHEDRVDAQELPTDHRAGFVAVVGRPNVGKSTLMNAFLGEKLAIVSPKPQTTRERQIGILTLPEAQLIFVDTPGIHKARTKLGEFMVESATEAIPDADAILFVVDVSQAPGPADQVIAGLIRERIDIPIILALNKVDLTASDDIQSHVDAYQDLVPIAQAITLSATAGQGRNEVLQALIRALPLGPRYYPPDQLTETRLRDSAAEIIREKVLLLYEEEIPHSVAVQVEEFKERSENLTYIAATIYVEKDSQKGILIGHKGQALKKVGEKARPDLEDLIGTQVYLELWVKVLKNWRKSESALKRLGYRQRR